MTEPTSASTEASPARPKAKQGGLVEWLWRGRALAEARAIRSKLPLVERQAIERALVARELADRAFEPVEQLRHGSALPLSVSLYREAAHWALVAHGASGDGLAALFDTASPSLLESAAGGADAVARVRAALVERDFVATTGLPPELIARDAALARGFVHALVDAKLLPESRVGGLLLQRGARLLGLFLLLLGVVFGGAALVSRLRQTPDLAAGKPWRASSSSDTCRPAEHRCAGAHTDMFFTTNEESAPWFEIDLGKDTTFNSVEVTNRSDCCPDRAVPLIIEVSRDREKFREVSRRTDTFSFWQARFQVQTARYVRLRVPRRSILHLEKVVVRHAR